MKLKEIRQKAGYRTQNDFAKAINFSKSRWGCIEANEKLILSLTFEKAYLVSKMLKIRFDELYRMGVNGGN